MMRNSAHGYGIGFFISGCECDLQNTGRGLCILIEHFVEVPHPEKQNGIRVFLFDSPILLHHGGVIDLNTFG